VGRKATTPTDPDDLGQARGGAGGSPYPERATCKNACGRRSSAGRGGYCYRCGRSSAGATRESRRPRSTGAGKKSVFQSVTPAEWQAIWRSQAGVCLICLHPLRNRYDERDQAGTRVGALDHDHELESKLKKQGTPLDQALRLSIRGLLCAFPCNRLLVRHWNATRLQNAARYAAELPAQKVLMHGAHS
jgi:hypothetical protein